MNKKGHTCKAEGILMNNQVDRYHIVSGDFECIPLMNKIKKVEFASVKIIDLK